MPSEQDLTRALKRSRAWVEEWYEILKKAEGEKFDKPRERARAMIETIDYLIPPPVEAPPPPITVIPPCIRCGHSQVLHGDGKAGPCKYELCLCPGFVLTIIVQDPEA